ncbi:MAG: ribosome maturation factor RimM [Myxococcales bacterium]|nr:ribosome maturation factor RimM [Myxococcales bacterium]MDD9967814.1 ribosome maturation factor RimM [Myxococcales bacterium]
MAPERPRLVPLGQVMGAHGVHGDLKVKAHNPDSDLLLDADRVILSLAGTEQPMEVRSVRVHGKGLLIELSGCSSREEAQALYGAQVCVPRAELPEPEEGEFYLVDTIGAQAVAPDGTELGTVEAFRAYPTADVLCIRCPDGLREVPVLPPYLVGVDLEGQRVILDHLEDIEPEPDKRRRG